MSRILNIRLKIVVSLITLVMLMPFISLFLEILNKDAWIFTFTSNKTYLAFLTTIIISIFTLLLNMIFGIPAAYVLSRKKFYGEKIINILIFLPLIIPPFVTSMGIYFTFIKLSLAETILGVVMVHTVQTLPYFIRSVVIGYDTLDETYELVGKFMGANGWQRFTKITLPHIFPSLIAGSSLVIIVSFAQYLTTLIIGGGRIITIPILMFPYISGGDIKVGGVYSLSFIIINLVLIVSLESVVKKIYKENNKG